MTNAFRILFMVEVLHDFYKDGKCSDFRFIPNKETEQLLRDCKALYKTVGNKLVVLIRADENGKSFIYPKPTDRFTFYLELMQPLFMTVSGLELAALSTRRFYFTNIHQNKVTDAGNDVLYLTEKIDGYDGGKTYYPGDVVKASAVIYECIKNSIGHLPPDPGFWISRNKNQYAAAKDMLQFVPQRKNFAVLPAAALVNISVFGLNPVNNMFDVPKQQQILHYESAVSEVAVDFSALPEAKYKLDINGKEMLVYVSNAAVYQNMFGVIDLYNHLHDGNDFAFFDAAGKTKDRVIASKTLWLTYSIRFANRIAYWKYVVPGKGIQSINGTPLFSFNGNANPADVFISQQPIPLLEKPYEIKLSLFNPVGSEPPLAPNPDINASGMLTRDGTDYYCNIYLNY